MNLSVLLEALRVHPDALLSLHQPDGSAVPAHFHITEVGRVRKDFIDCGGTVRSLERCVLQVWVADDLNHRVTAGKLAKIIGLARPLLGEGDLPVEIEYDTSRRCPSWRWKPTMNASRCVWAGSTPPASPRTVAASPTPPAPPAAAARRQRRSGRCRLGCARGQRRRLGINRGFDWLISLAIIDSLVGDWKISRGRSGETRDFIFSIVMFFV